LGDWNVGDAFSRSRLWTSHPCSSSRGAQLMGFCRATGGQVIVSRAAVQDIVGSEIVGRERRWRDWGEVPLQPGGMASDSG